MCLGWTWIRWLPALRVNSASQEEQINLDYLKAATHVVQLGDMEVSVTEQGSLESSDNVEIICKVRGQNTVTWAVESGSYVEEAMLFFSRHALYRRTNR